MDPNTSKLELLDRFKEDDTEIEELSRIEEAELLQSPKFKRMQSLSPPKSAPSSPSKRSSSSSSHPNNFNNENSNLFDSVPKLNYKDYNQLLKTPSKSARKPLVKPFHRHAPLKFSVPSPTKISHSQDHKVSLTPAQRLEKKPGKLLTTSDILASYDFKETVGRGAFANVYRAINKTTGDEVAVKEIFIEDDDDILELMSEIDLLKILKHKNIVKYHGFIRNEKKLLIFLEYCSGGSLRTMYKKSGPLSESAVIGLMKQVLNGLVYLHEQGVVHRDVKAANILLTKSGDVKLTDFGVSTKVSNNTIKTFSIAGTPNWMAPEIISMDGTCTASDVWSLGATVVELLTGEPLYSHLHEMAALHAIVVDDHPPIPDFVSPACKDFLLQCFEKQPLTRVTAKDLLNHQWLNDKTSSKKSDATLYRSLKKKKKDTGWDFNSIKRFNTRNFLPLEINTFKHTEIGQETDGELTNEFNELVLEDDIKFSTSKFEPINISSNTEFEQVLTRLEQDPYNDESLRQVFDALKSKSGKVMARIMFNNGYVFKLIQYIEGKYSSDEGLLLAYLKILRGIIDHIDESGSELVDLAGLPLISKFIHSKYGKAVRIETIHLLQSIFSTNDSYIRSFVQFGSLRNALKLLQEDYKEETLFTLFIIDLLHTINVKSLIPKKALMKLLSAYTNFLDWIAVVLLQFVNFGDSKAVDKTVDIISSLQGSKLFLVRPIFLNSIFKMFGKLSPKNQRSLMRFLQSINVNDIPENSALLKFLVKTLKRFGTTKPLDSDLLDMTTSIIFSLCHLNYKMQIELMNLDPLPVFQQLLSLTLPCSEYIIPLICEFSFNSQINNQLLQKDSVILQNYLALLVDPIWQSNALDSILALHDISTNDPEVIPKLLRDDGSKFLIQSFLVGDSLNYELYLERLTKLLGFHTKSMVINQIRLDFFHDSRVITEIFKKINKHRSESVICIDLLKLLKLLVIGNYEHENYRKVIEYLHTLKNSNTLLIDQLISEILGLENEKERSLMKPPPQFTVPAPRLKLKNVNRALS